MGPTGSGKTTVSLNEAKTSKKKNLILCQLINLASRSNLVVGEGLELGTLEVNVALVFELDDRLVTLIDTPCFDDTNRSGADILVEKTVYALFPKKKKSHTPRDQV